MQLLSNQFVLPVASAPGRCRVSSRRLSLPPAWPNAQIGLGQWFRVVTGVVEVSGAVALLIPGLASIGALWLGGTMVGAVATHVFVLHTSPVPAIVLGLLNAVVVYLRRDELVDLLHRVKG